MGMAVGYIFYHIPFYFFCTMFSGIVEEGAIVTALHKDNDNLNISTALEGVEIFNTPSTYGYGVETCTEARKEAEKKIWGKDLE